MNHLSMTSKLYAGFMGLLVLAVAFLGTISALWFWNQQSANLDQFLGAEAQSAVNRLEGMVEGLLVGGTQDPDAVVQALRRDVEIFLSQRLNRAVPYKTTLLILDNRGRILAQSNRALDLYGLDTDLSRMTIRDVRDRHPEFRVLSQPFSLGPGGRGTLLVACLLSGLDGPKISFLTSLVLLLAGSLILFSALGAGLIRQTLQPIHQMTEAASQISDQNLDARIPVPPGKDELSRLAQTLNGLLSRLETDFAFQESLVGDLTHQLKTPLTILRGRNELTLSSAQDIQDFRDLVEDNLSDIDALVNLLNTLLELARLDGRIDRLKTHTVSVGDLVRRLGDDLMPLWLSKDLRFLADGPELSVPGDDEALRQVLTNLYDNSWKFAPPGSAVRTSWTEDRALQRIRITVTNEGPGIPIADRERIFKRFYRAKDADSSNVPGVGLGLSIVRTLVGLHGGSVAVFDPPGGGAGFEILLPTEGGPG